MWCHENQSRVCEKRWEDILELTKLQWWIYYSAATILKIHKLDYFTDDTILTSSLFLT